VRDFKMRLRLSALAFFPAALGLAGCGGNMAPAGPRSGGGGTGGGGQQTSGTGGGAGGGSSGSTGIGGQSASGGRGGTGGGVTGPLSPQDAARLMSPGWNLGNSFDASPKETSYGNPTPTQTLINAVHAAGFKMLRIPVTWTSHIGAAPSYTIDATWMNKVKQTAQWAVSAG